MANQPSRRQGEREPTSMTRSEGERGLASRPYYDPFSLMDSLFERMQRDFFGTSLFNALMPARGGEGGQGTPAVRVPRLHARDTGDAIELVAELPGVEPENVNVELEGDVLTISGESQSQQESDGRRTEQYASFYRQVPLPDNVDPDQVQTSFRHGVLTLRFPKRDRRRNVRQIPINTEGSGTQSAQQGAGQQGKEHAA